MNRWGKQERQPINLAVPKGAGVWDEEKRHEWWQALAPFPLLLTFFTI